VQGAKSHDLSNGVLIYSAETSGTIDSNPIQNHHLMFVDEAAPHFAVVREAAEHAAALHKQILHILVPVATMSGVMDYFGVTAHELPHSVLTNMTTGTLTSTPPTGSPFTRLRSGRDPPPPQFAGMKNFHFEPKGDYSGATVAAFEASFLAGHARRHLKTAAPPPTPDLQHGQNGVRVLVGSMLEQALFGNRGDVLLFVYKVRGGGGGERHSPVHLCHPRNHNHWR
jgi:hypothetical protein